ncbi:uncharacterized protein LOC135478208 [Liolophura sinensis]|uniref:uncharacterized protein LOC135478208 n=1 Tax=Liolophura sinensis TaxID=3198878 RepID=UPI00315822DA
MEALRQLGTLLVLVTTVHSSWSLCQDHPVNNSRDECEMRFKVQRHEIVGQLTTREQIDNVCRIYPEYENCLKELIKDCPKDQSFLDMQGYDQNSTLVAFEGFCADRDDYLKGVSCFNTNNAAILRCFSNHSMGRRDAMYEVLRTRNWEKFYETLCPLQVTGAKCVADAVASCSADVRETLTNIAYALMHGRCKVKKYGSFQSKYDRLYGLSSRSVTSSGLLTLALGVLTVCKKWTTD